MIDKKAYAKAYYEKNKAKLAEQKKKRYNEDSAYKDAIKVRATERWLKRRREKIISKMKDIDEIARTVDRRNFRILFIGDEQVKFFGVEVFAKIIGTTSTSVRSWHKLRILPEPGYVVSYEKTTKRWYSERYIANVMNVLINRTSSNMAAFTEDIKAEFLSNPDVQINAKVTVNDEDIKEMDEKYGSEVY